jgi:opacity protein-like surface antigen
MRRSIAGPILLLLPLALATPAGAQGQRAQGPSLGWNGWGLRLGVSTDPDQAWGGVHFELGEFARNVRLRPTIEIGVGDDATVIQGLAEVHYVFSKVQVWKPYVGGGVGLIHVNADIDTPLGTEEVSDNELSLMGVGGVETRLKSGTRFFLEGKVGLNNDSPDLKLGAGWSWK